MNTRITYLYRDACNYKSYGETILDGTLSPEQIGIILSCLHDGEYFIPNMVCLEAFRNFEFDPAVDTEFWELNRNDFTETGKDPTTDVTPDQLVSYFLEARDHWDEYQPIRD